MSDAGLLRRAIEEEPGDRGRTWSDGAESRGAGEVLPLLRNRRDAALELLRQLKDARQAAGVSRYATAASALSPKTSTPISTTHWQLAMVTR